MIFISLFRLYFIYFCFFWIFLYNSCFADLASNTVFLTWQRNPETTMTIQWISLIGQNNDQIYYRPVGELEWQMIKGSHFPFPQSSEYLIHRVELVNLTPYTLYQFKISDQAYYFHTMPIHTETPVRFVVGGDMLHNRIELMKETSRQAAKMNPAFALIGGDIAYSVMKVNAPQNIQRWIEWIRAWHECMRTADGRLIPIIAAIGNHEISGHFDQNPSQARVFSALFPMPGEQIYNVLDFGNYMSIYILDSGHANPIDGEQTNWLKDALMVRQDRLHQFAIYHVPAYPSIRSFYNKYSTTIRQQWVPLFEKGGINIVFEHHDHAYKRTYPLLHNHIHPQGVVYIGDGAWGVEQTRQPQSNKKIFYLAKFASARHFILVTLHHREQHIMSINPQGQVLDEYRAYVSESNSIEKEQQEDNIVPAEELVETQ